MNDFAKSPLITPDRLARENPEDIFRIKPKWAAFIELLRPGEGLSAEEDVFHISVHGSKGAFADALYSPVFVAILFELTRFGNNVTANIRERGDTRLYVKLTFADAPKDNMPVWRLIMDALPGEQVEFVEGQEDQRAVNLTKATRGTAVKAARSAAMHHAEEAAKKISRLTLQGTSTI